MSNGGIWIAGATGRIGRAVAERLVRDGFAPVLIGRNEASLRGVADRAGRGAIIKVATSISDLAEMIARQRPSVVLNTIGPFSTTALPIAQACRPGTHYADLSNEFPSVQAILALHDQAVSAQSTFVTGAGFGVLGTESVVLKLCEGRPPAARVRCAAIPAVVGEAGPLGEAFAASITEGFAFGGRRYEGGRLVRASALGDYELVRLPDGRAVGTASVPSGELEAARRASGAPFAVSATSMVPSAPVLRAMIPTLLTIMKIAPVRRFAARRIAAIEMKPSALKAAPVSWSYARVISKSEIAREGWMRSGDAMVFTSDVLARVAVLLNEGQSAPGAYTPGALFGSQLASKCGGEFLNFG